MEPKEPELQTPTESVSLEAPPAPDAPAGGIATLFGDDSIIMTSSKLAVMESLLALIAKESKFHDFMREILVCVMKVLKSEAGSILEVDQKSGTLFFRAVVGQSSDRVARFIIPIGQGLVGYVAESKQPMIVNNVEENRVYLKSIEKVVGFEARNVVALPLIIRGRVFGVLELLNRVGEDNYTPADVELLTYTCEAASRAIEIRLMIAWAIRAGKGKAA